MDSEVDIPEETMQLIEELLSRHDPGIVHYMIGQVVESRRNSVVSTYPSHWSNIPTTSSTASSLRSRRSIASIFSTSTSSTHTAPSITSSAGSTRTASSFASSISSRIRRVEPLSYPTGFGPNRPLPPPPTKKPPVDIVQDLPENDRSDDNRFFCTYCAEMEIHRPFKFKSDWKLHEMRMHETGEDWPCIVDRCNRVFDRQKDFIKHHQRYHSGRPFPPLTDIGVVLLPRKVFGCGFKKCKEVSIGWDERCDHVVNHMKKGSSFDQWLYSQVIRNLIRQEGLNYAWKEMIAYLDKPLREAASSICWNPDNSRILRQKLQCCDYRPSREEVLITALSLRSDIPLDISLQALPSGFITPSRNSTPNADRETRMKILLGTSEHFLQGAARTRLAVINAALRNRYTVPEVINYDTYDSKRHLEPSAANTIGRDMDPMLLDNDADEIFDSWQSIVPKLPTNLGDDNSLATEGGNAEDSGAVHLMMPFSPPRPDSPTIFQPPNLANLKEVHRKLKVHIDDMATIEFSPDGSPIEEVPQTLPSRDNSSGALTPHPNANQPTLESHEMARVPHNEVVALTSIPEAPPSIIEAFSCIPETLSTIPEESISDEMEDTEALEDIPPVGDVPPSPRLSIAEKMQRNLSAFLAAVGLKECDIPTGHKRIRWTNSRGKKLFDDYIEHEPGALQALENYLKTSTYRSRDPGSGQTQQPAPCTYCRSHSSPNSSSSTIRQVSGDIADQGSEPKNIVKGDVEQARNNSHTLHLMCSIVGGRYVTKLNQEPLTHISSDQELFYTLRKSYHELRGKLKPFMSLTAVHNIQFMKLMYGGDKYIDVRCHEVLCERGKPCDCIPPASNADYRCNPRPPRWSPPIGPNLMMDHFSHPENIDQDDQWIVEQLPKRTCGELRRLQATSELQEAWGIHFSESWDLFKIWWIVIVGFVVPSLLFGILWSYMKKDVQGGMGVAGLWLTCCTIFMGFFASYTWRSQRYLDG